MNLEKHRSYSLPQWRKICDSSEHQPPAKRGEARRVGGRKESQRKIPEPPATPPATTDSDSGSPEPHDHKSKSRSKSKSSGRAPHTEPDFNYRIDDNDQYTAERCQDLERAYWKSLTFNNPMYGADLPGSLFEDDTKEWNVAHLDNILNRLGVVLPGVNSAYLYLGMWKATFSWHVEDMDLYSINYIHFGAPKQWYSVSQEDNQKFERVMKDIFPNDARHCDQFMRHKTFGASPARLAQHDLHVNKLVHYEKEFVITFPYGYHSGYNLGYNCAESVNFATEEWLEYGKVARKCECVTDAVSIDVNDIIRAVNGQDASVHDQDSVLTPPTSDNESEDTAERPTYSEFDRLRRSNKKKRSKDVLYEKAPIAQYKKLSDRYHAAKPSSPEKPVLKKIKLSMPKAPCELCSKAPKAEDLVDAGKKRKVHRICAEFIPETTIETVAGMEEVVGLDSVDKARKALRCALCKVTSGACFQCSSPKCVRAFHGTCAYDAGVLVQKLDVTKRGATAYHFLCKTHRPRRPAPELLEFDTNITQFASALQAGAIVQAQFATGHCFSGYVRENRRSERTLVIEVGNDADLIEVDYQWILAAPRRPLPSMRSLTLENSLENSSEVRRTLQDVVATESSPPSQSSLLQTSQDAGKFHANSSSIDPPIAIPPHVGVPESNPPPALDRVMNVFVSPTGRYQGNPVGNYPNRPQVHGLMHTTPQLPMGLTYNLPQRIYVPQYAGPPGGYPLPAGSCIPGPSQYVHAGIDQLNAASNPARPITSQEQGP